MSRASDASLSRLIVVLGPTASGKSALAIKLAKLVDGEILVCDSTQVYRRFDIGTGKVPLAEQQEIPHHLMDMVEPDAVFTAGEYRRRAVATLDDLRARGKTPVITAGTGLYLRALLEGLAESPERSEDLRERMRAIVAKHGPARLHDILKRLDPENCAAHRARRHSKNHSRHRTATARRKNSGRNSCGRSRSVGGLRNREDRACAAASRALRAHPLAHRRDDRRGLDRRGPASHK